MPDLKLGQILATPDKGWQRIYNNNANFTYTGFASGGDGNFSSGYDYYTSTTDGSVIGSTVTEIRINFSGPRLRVINLMTNNSASSNKTYSVSVFIDGKNYGKLYDNPSANWVYKTVTFGVDDLSNGMHSLILRVNSDSTRFWFDSIDIGDADNYGFVEKYNTKDSLEATYNDFLQDYADKLSAAKVGDIITCLYSVPDTTKMGSYTDLKFEDRQVPYYIKNATITHFIPDEFEFVENTYTKKYPELYEMCSDGFKFNYMADLKGKTVDAVNDFKEFIDINVTSQKALVIPHDVVIKTKALIPFEDLASSNLLSVSINSLRSDTEVYILLSTDNTTFKTFNKTTKAWDTVTDTSSTNIQSVGISDFSDITAAEMATLGADTSKGIGVMAAIGIKDPDDIEYFDTKTQMLFTTITNTTDSSIRSEIYKLNLYCISVDESVSKLYPKKSFLSEYVTQNGISFANLTSDFDASDKNHYRISGSLYTAKLYTNIVNVSDYVSAIDNDQFAKYDYSFVDRDDDDDNNVRTRHEIETNSNTGFRPNLVIDLKQDIFHRYQSDTPLPIAKRLVDILPGQAYPVSYIANTKNTVGTFISGKNKKTIIPDYGGETVNGYFYFICVGYEPDGSKKCIADRNIQTNIDYEQLYKAGFCAPEGLSMMLGSAKNSSMRLPKTVSDTKSGQNNKNEWDETVSYNSLSGVISPSDNDVWNATSIRSWTMSMLQSHTNGSHIVRGPQDKDNVVTEYTQSEEGYNTTDITLGFRPVLIIHPTSSRTYPDTTLTVVKNFGQDCKVGCAVPCEYKANTAGKAGIFDFNYDTKLSVIPDRARSTEYGKFYWICVGYEPDGSKKFVADRNLQTSISWDALNDAGFCSDAGVDYSSGTKIIGSYIRLIKSNVTNYSMNKSESEWDQILMSDKVGNSSIDVNNNYNISKTKSWMMNVPTETDYSGKAISDNDRVVRGAEPIDYSSKPRLFTSSDKELESVGFRPILVVPANQYVVVDFTVNTTHVNETNGYNNKTSVIGSYYYFSSKANDSNTTLKLMHWKTENVQQTNSSGVPLWSWVDPTDVSGAVHTLASATIPVPGTTPGLPATAIATMLVTTITSKKVVQYKKTDGTYADIDITRNATDKTISFDIPITADIDYHENNLFIEANTNDKVITDFPFIFVKEKKGDNEKYRDYHEYTGGFTYDGLTVVNDRVVNNITYTKSGAPSSFAIPPNIKKIVLTED